MAGDFGRVTYASGNSYTARRRRVYTGRYVTVDYKPDRASIAKCAVGPEMKANVFDLATRKALPYAISISPRSDVEINRDGTPHEHYQDKFKVEMGHAYAGFPKMRRVAAMLLNTSDHAAGVEWGNKNSPEGHRVLGKTLDHLNSTVQL